MLILLMVMIGCEVVPRHVQEESEVDTFIGQQAYASACVALHNRADPDLRTYAAEQLVRLSTKPVPAQCLCAALYDSERHEADLAVAKGVQNSHRNDLGKCLGAALSDPKVEERENVAAALGAMDAEAGYAVLEEVAQSGEDTSIRAAATRGLLSSPRARETLIALVLGDESAEVRMEAARALSGRQHKTVVTAIAKVLDEEKENEVRAAALRALVTSDAEGSLTKVCDVLLTDPDATMRIGAAEALHGSKKTKAIRCLKKRLLTNEENPAVRTKVMAALGASPSDKASKALCTLIAPMMKLYVKDRIAEQTEGVDIITYQNNRDWEKSFACVAAALKTPGLSCYARNHLGRWMNDLGGKAARPLCPGMKRK